jgi:hypothetical protein
MKKQLIALTALLVVSAAQCSYYERAKAAASNAYQSARNKLSGMNVSNLSEAKAMAQEKLASLKDMVKDSPLREKALDLRYSRAIKAGTITKEVYNDPKTGKRIVSYYEAD